MYDDEDEKTKRKAHIDKMKAINNQNDHSKQMAMTAAERNWLMLENVKKAAKRVGSNQRGHHQMQPSNQSLHSSLERPLEARSHQNQFPKWQPVSQPQPLVELKSHIAGS